MGINIGPWVLGLSLLGENGGNDFVDLGNELEEGVVGEVLEGKLSLGGVSGIGLSQHSVSESGNNASSVESFPNNFSETLVGDLLASELLLEVEGPGEHLLVGKTVEGTSETVETSGEGEVGVREGRSDKVSGVSGDVSSLVVTVDDEVETHELIKLGLVESEHASKVSSPVELAVIGNELVVSVGVLVDHTSNRGQLGCNIIRCRVNKGK